MYRLLLSAALVMFVYSPPLPACRVTEIGVPTQKVLNLSTITKTQLERIIDRWPTKSRYIKAEKLRRWYDSAGEPVAELSRQNERGIKPAVEFTQGASDFRFARVYRNGRQIGFASWVLRDGKWELFHSQWDESRLPTRHGRKAESSSAQRKSCRRKCLSAETAVRLTPMGNVRTQKMADICVDRASTLQPSD